MKKRNLLMSLMLSLALLAGSSGAAAASILPDARRCNGDPDEFQARQVLDEGIVLGRGALDAQPGRDGAAGGEVRQPMRSARERVDRPLGRGRFVVALSGKHVFLER